MEPADTEVSMSLRFLSSATGTTPASQGGICSLDGTCLHLQDSDYENPDEHSDSEMYVMPAEETGDDSYEPPPAEQQTRVVHPALPFSRGEYVGEAAVDAGTTGWGDGQTAAA